MLNLDKQEKAALKRFFLSGDAGRPYPSEKDESQGLLADMLAVGKIEKDYPIQKIRGYRLFVAWFHPDRSEAAWKEIKASNPDGNWNAEIRRFIEINGSMQELCPDGESFFDGLEGRLVTLFCLDRLNREDHLSLDDRQYRIEIEKGLSIARSLEACINDENLNPYHKSRWQVQRWRDAMLQGYEEFHGFDRLIKSVDRALKNPTEYNGVSLQIAEEVAEVLDDPALPQEAKEYIADIRAGKSRRKKVARKPLP
jgi:hypothetical protein